MKRAAGTSLIQMRMQSFEFPQGLKPSVNFSVLRHD